MSLRRTGLPSLILLALAVVLGGASCGEDPQPDWQLVWSDEFDGPAGALPDPGNWRFDVGTGWGNRQLEFDTKRPENVSTDGNGNLAIIAREEDYQGSRYTSGRINTLGFFDQAMGRFEARIKLPIGQGIWPAFWMLGSDFQQVGWPTCGEIDIMEYRGQEPRRLIGSLHGPGYSGGASVGGSTLYDGGGLNDGFHIYAIEWDEDGITWFLDDLAYQTKGIRSVPGQWVFDHPFFIILNVAVGGNFVGSPDETTIFPQTMLVDYVRVYQRGS